MEKKQIFSEDERSSLLPQYEPLTRRPHYRPFTEFLVLLVIILVTLGSGLACLFRIPVLRLGVTNFSPDGPGLGLALSTHGGHVAVRTDDGSIENVAYIEADEAYVDLLQRLSLPSSRHPTPPYSSLSESISDRPRQWRRAFRKRLGFPASSEAGILASLMQNLVNAAQQRFPEYAALDAALAVIPNAMALYTEDVRDALEYIGVHQLTGHNVYGAPRALPAAYAGYGMGLCTSPEDFDACTQEEKDFGRRGVVIVDAGDEALATDARGMDTPMYVFNDQYALLDWHAWKSNSEPDWSRISSDISFAITGLQQRSPRTAKPIDDILMAGTKGDDKKLIEIVRSVVAEYQDKEATIRCEEPQWVVARGAAELAKRLLILRERVI